MTKWRTNHDHWRIQSVKCSYWNLWGVLLYILLLYTIFWLTKALPSIRVIYVRHLDANLLVWLDLLFCVSLWDLHEPDRVRVELNIWEKEWFLRGKAMTSPTLHFNVFSLSLKNGTRRLHTSLCTHSLWEHRFPQTENGAELNQDCRVGGEGRWHERQSINCGCEITLSSHYKEKARLCKFWNMSTVCLGAQATIERALRQAQTKVPFFLFLTLPCNACDGWEDINVFHCVHVLEILYMVTLSQHND